MDKHRATLGELKSLLQSDNSIKADSLVAMMKGDELQFIGSCSFLNMGGAYDWIQENGDPLEIKQGGIIALLTESTFKTKSGTVEDKKSYKDLVGGYNPVLRAERPQDLKTLMLKMYSMTSGGNVKAKEDAIFIGWQGSIVNEIKVISDITIYASCSYGHKVTFSPKVPMLVFVSNEEVKQTFNAARGGSSRFESIKTFKEYKK